MIAAAINKVLTLTINLNSKMLIFTMLAGDAADSPGACAGFAAGRCIR
jgi:hypothetical protein